MEFITKTELFFIQLQYCLAIEQEPLLIGEKGIYNLMLKPDVFFKLIHDFNIDYPFIPENKIIELKYLMSKENINTKDALRIIENYKEQYWFLDTVVIFEPVIDKLKRTFKSIDSNVSEQEIYIDYQKLLQTKRESIYFDLINAIQGLPPKQTETETDKLKVKQIALIHVYEGTQITRENAGEIAAKHGYTAKNSGEGLFQDYTNYCSAANRKGKPTPCTPKKLKNKIELLESVVNYLSDNSKQRAIDEIRILKTIFENEYQ